jgi:hypothetical protein
MILPILFILTVLPTFAQDEDKPMMIELTPVTTKQELKKLGAKDADINKAIEQSKKDLIDMVGEEEAKKFQPIGVDVEVLKTSLLPGSDKDDYIKAMGNVHNPGSIEVCEEDKVKSPLIDLSKKSELVVQKLEQESGKQNGGMIYVMWGYNRGYHSAADTTFHTPNGTFTIHDAVGYDRPTKFGIAYLDPTQMSKPQYNIRIGYQFNEKWAVEIGQDHMKWVFDPSRQYEITGDYDKPLWGHVPFEQVKESGNAGFVLFEHTDGYNYVHAGPVFTKNLFTTKNDRFRVDASAGAGLGLLVPKTRVRIWDEADGGLRDVDNKFKVAGWGAHVDGRLKMSYRLKNGKEFFVLGSARFSHGKINNALFLGSGDGKITQEPIYTTQVIVAAGTSIPVFDLIGKKKKKAKK